MPTTKRLVDKRRPHDELYQFSIQACPHRVDAFTPIVNPPDVAILGVGGRDRLPETAAEVLIPDFCGSRADLETVLTAEPDVLKHNLETVDSFYHRVRPEADYRRSLAVLAWSKTQAPKLVTKSGLMLGLGEKTGEVLRVLYDLRQACCDLLILGQYLQPADHQLWGSIPMRLSWWGW